jgi:hypothetical protein
MDRFAMDVSKLELISIRVKGYIQWTRLGNSVWGQIVSGAKFGVDYGLSFFGNG